MKKTIVAKLFSLLFLALLITYSCSKGNDFEKTELSSNDYFVELSAIEDIANGIYFPTDGSSNLKSTEPKTKAVKDIDEIRNKTNKTSYYIVNYNEGGFIILSADKRAYPVLGYSINKNFEVDETLYLPNLRFWMKDASAQIEAIQVSDCVQSPKEEKA